MFKSYYITHKINTTEYFLYSVKRQTNAQRKCSNALKRINENVAKSMQTMCASSNLMQK